MVDFVLADEDDPVVEAVMAVGEEGLAAAPLVEREAPPRGIKIFRFPRRLEDRLAGMSHPPGCTCTGCAPKL